MLCEECAQNDACVHLTDVVDGQKKTLRLCKACAGEKGYVIDQDEIGKGTSPAQKVIAPLVVPVLQDLQQGGGAATQRRCPTCGLTWRDFKKVSRFGCPEDYEVFGEAIQRLLKKIHGSDHHQGRAPRAAQARVTRDRRLREYRSELEGAVKSEDYEKAARLRDQIRALESEEDSRLGAN